ncbi:MAG: aminotransferase class I/II-fold pyridoxal phosphate-dependent enzyme [Phycisphaerae bacterium]|nr:aminotransferase class I/II-fold pyridoxal phosphate-dependent enzyme [Phycisphaerae bacterium]
MPVDTTTLPLDRLLSRRAKSIDASGIRKVFDLAAKMKDPINLSIGQPDFPVPEAMKRAAIDAILENRNGYTVTQGIPPLLEAIWRRLGEDVGWSGPSAERGAIVTSGTSGALLLAFMCLLDPGDEAIVPDPYFVMYPQLGALTGGTIVTCDTYPDFRMTAARVERLITPKTKAVLVNSPSNPCGMVLAERELADLVDLCRAKGVLLVSDEIYDEFVFADAKEDGRFPTPARFTQDLLLIRGFGKSYGCTGWRLGYAAGPQELIQAMARLQQYTFVCAPSMAQWGVLPAFETDMSGEVERYRGRRDAVLDAFRGVAVVPQPGGAFYAFVEVPPALGLSATAFVERAIEARVLVIPGKVFSRRDSHFRLSYATHESKLHEGLGILRGLMTK